METTRKRRWWQFGLRSVLAFTAIYAIYVSIELGFWRLMGIRDFNNTEITIECSVLFVVCALATISGRFALLLDVDFDWRRGCLRLCLATLSAALFALPFLWMFVAALAVSVLGLPATQC